MCNDVVTATITYNMVQIEQHEYMIGISIYIETEQRFVHKIERTYTTLEPLAVRHVIKLFNSNIYRCFIVTYLNNIVTQ